MKWIKDRKPVGVTSFGTMSINVAVHYYSEYDKKIITGSGRYCHDRKQWFVIGLDNPNVEVIEWLDESIQEPDLKEGFQKCKEWYYKVFEETNTSPSFEDTIKYLEDYLVSSGIKIASSVSTRPSGSSNSDERESVRCTICGKEFTDVETKGINRCPNCGTKSVPCAISEDVSIKINWHELRILVIWAEQWGRHIDKYPEEVEKQKTEPYNHLYTIMCIAQRLQGQFPDKTPLTLFSEIKEIAKKYDIETNYKDEELGI